MLHEVTQMGEGLPYRNSVGLCLFNRQGLVFCAERRDKRGCWQMPQGGIQKGEDPAKAVFREMKEEVGTDKAELIARHPEKLRYDFPDHLQMKDGIFHGKYRGQEQVWFALRYLGEDAEIDLSGQYETETPEFIAWKWVELAATPLLIVDFKKPVYDAVVSAFKPLSLSLQRGEALPPWSGE